jgi:hypothetical protein
MSFMDKPTKCEALDFNAEFLAKNAKLREGRAPSRPSKPAPICPARECPPVVTAL